VTVPIVPLLPSRALAHIILFYRRAGGNKHIGIEFPHHYRPGLEGKVREKCEGENDEAATVVLIPSPLRRSVTLSFR
jgi:hypothetical protein